MIDKFLDYYYFLSNFYPHTISYPYPNCKGGPWLTDWKVKYYRSTEHAYQAFKADNEAEHEYIRNLDTAGKAKRAGRNVSVRKDWEEIKCDLMLDLVRVKFDDIGLARKLVETDNEELVEGNYWHDNVWGKCTCEHCSTIEGKNWLGKILMIVRDEMRVKLEDLKKGWEDLKDFDNKHFE
jgi:hypothetical protein